jgi:integrase
VALTDTAIRKSKPGEKPVKLFDGAGLFLLVQPTGGKLWRLKYRFEGKEKLLSLGAYPEVSLADARERRDAARKQLAAGVDPSQARKDEKTARQVAAANSFESVARAWWEHWKGPKSARHADYVIRRLELDVFPVIGAKPASAITAPQLLAMAKKIEQRGALDIAKRALQTTGQVFRYAVAHGIVERNPAADVRPGDALKPRKKTHYARVDAKELPELLRKIEAYNGSPFTRIAMKLMALTFVRTSELIGARWDEFDLEAAEWRIPGERMKMKTPHIVPLATQAVELLQVLREIRPAGLLFPGERDHEKPMSNNTILKALERMGYAGRMTGHGFRGVASTILHELGFDHAHIELQLAHQERDDTSAAYNFATYLPQRRKMMQAYADHLDALRKGAKVLPLRAA